MHPTCLGEDSGVIWTSYRGMHVVMSLLSVSLVCLCACLSICLFVSCVAGMYAVIVNYNLYIS